jgi:CheY-like chemotaxis protein
MHTAVLEVDQNFQRPLLGDPTINALILDDSKFDRRRIRRISRDMGLPMLLDEVASITALRQILDEDSFDLIFLDYLLAEGDGLQALEMVQTHPSHHHCPVIMLAGGDDPDVAAQAIERGCSGYLSKSQLTAQGLRRAVVAAIDAAERAAKAERSPAKDRRPGGLG